MSFLRLLPGPASPHFTTLRCHRPAQGTAHAHLSLPGMSSLVNRSQKGLPTLVLPRSLAPPWDTFLGTFSCGLPHSTQPVKPAHWTMPSAALSAPPCLSFGPDMPIRFPFKAEIGACLSRSHMTASLAHQHMLSWVLRDPCGPPRKSSSSLSYFALGFH